jgi:hypothetical protein
MSFAAAGVERCGWLFLREQYLCCADPEARCQRSATFLPEVARHERWSCEETMDALIAKAGFAGHVTGDLRASLAVTRYQSSAAAMTYDEYCAARQPAPSQAPASGGVAITVPA